MELNVPSIIEQLENSIQFRAVRVMFDCVLVNKAEIFEFIDKIYAEVPIDVQTVRKNGGTPSSQHDGLDIYDYLKSLEDDCLDVFPILGFSIVRLKDLRTKIDNVKQAYNALIGR